MATVIFIGKKPSAQQVSSEQRILLHYTFAQVWLFQMQSITVAMRGNEARMHHLGSWVLYGHSPSSHFTAYPFQGTSLESGEDRYIRMSPDPWTLVILQVAVKQSLSLVVYRAVKI